MVSVSLARSLQTLVEAIKAVTDLLPDAGALDDLAAILVDTGTTLPALLVILQEALNELLKWATPVTGTHTTTGTTEETLLELTLTDPYRLWMYIRLAAMIAFDDFTFRVYTKTDGANYDLLSEQQLINTQTLKVYSIDGLYGDTACDIKVTVQRDSGTDRAFPYRYNYKKES